ncbi:hypothetical protein BA92_10140 [Sanguibacteroides justesenii]|uniref:Uncharacterized protein n=1 Tax=Sanguibacteroides justesenii TaxID=1547597 RepID=A0A0C3MDP4_9PORP|nr:hypothetical protein BA92_10140 [Sanguibacteroides justesenii]
MKSLDSTLKEAGFSEKFIDVIINADFPTNQYIEIENTNFQSHENIIQSSTTLEIKESNNMSANYFAIDIITE